jgi:trk system potassium uptake protein TrkA
MKSFVVIGLGRFGTSVALELASLGNEVVVIDRIEERINAIADDVTHALVADIRDENVLRRAGVAECDCAIVAFASNLQENILVTLLLKELGVPHVVAKASNAMHVRVLQKVGADQIVFPESDMGVRMARSLSSDAVLDYVDLDEEYKIAEIKCPVGWQNRPLRDLDLRAKHNINVLLIKSGGTGKRVIPDANTVLRPGDAVVVLGGEKAIEEISDDE